MNIFLPPMGMKMAADYLEIRRPASAAQWLFRALEASRAGFLPPSEILAHQPAGPCGSSGIL
jgi:hypothetical protein